MLVAGLEPTRTQFRDYSLSVRSTVELHQHGLGVSSSKRLQGRSYTNTLPKTLTVNIIILNFIWSVSSFERLAFDETHYEINESVKQVVMLLNPEPYKLVND